MTCDKCKMIEAREGKVVYSDPITHIILPEKPAAKGHARIYSKKHVETLFELDEEEVNHLFETASRTATVLFETLGAEGSNIIASEGSISGGHFFIDVVARSQEDDVGTRWKPQEVPEAEMEETSQQIANAVDTMEYNAPEASPKKSKTAENDVTEEMLKNVKRLP